MMLNPLIKEGTDLLMTTSSRRIYGFALLIPVIALFIILPPRVPAGGIGAGGPPPIFTAMGIILVIISSLSVMITLTLTTGQVERSRRWLRHMSLFAFVSGKTLTAVILSLIYSLLPLPFIVIALRFMPMPLMQGAVLSVHLFGIFLAYAFLVEILSVIISRFPLIRRIIIWAVYLFHMLLTLQLFPSINPFRTVQALSGLKQPEWKPLCIGLAALFILFIITAAAAKRMNTDE